MNFQNCHFSYDTRRAQRWRYSEEIDFKKVDPIVCDRRGRPLEGSPSLSPKWVYQVPPRGECTNCKQLLTFHLLLPREREETFIFFFVVFPGGSSRKTFLSAREKHDHRRRWRNGARETRLEQSFHSVSHWSRIPLSEVEQWSIRCWPSSMVSGDFERARGKCISDWRALVCHNGDNGIWLGNEKNILHHKNVVQLLFSTEIDQNMFQLFFDRHT